MGGVVDYIPKLNSDYYKFVILCYQGFKNHVKLSHNMWDYVYYSLYLDSIDTGDHTAIQKYVYEHVSDYPKKKK